MKRNLKIDLNGLKVETILRVQSEHSAGHFLPWKVATQKKYIFNTPSLTRNECCWAIDHMVVKEHKRKNNQ